MAGGDVVLERENPPLVSVQAMEGTGDTRSRLVKCVTMRLYTHDAPFLLLVVQGAAADTLSFLFLQKQRTE